jgi:hypothetical protein
LKIDKKLPPEELFRDCGCHSVGQLDGRVEEATEDWVNSASIFLSNVINKKLKNFNNKKILLNF